MCIKNDKLCIKNEELCIENDEFCSEHRSSFHLEFSEELARFLSIEIARVQVLQIKAGAKIMNVALKTRNFVSKSHKNEKLCIKITQKRGILHYK